EKEKLLSPPAVHLLIAEKKVDLGFGGFTIMARAHPELLRNYLRAYADTVKYIRSNPSVWESYGKEIGMSSGVGYMLNYWFGLFSMTQVLAWALSFTIVLLGIEFLLINPFEKRVTAWRAVVQV
ncbi:MAG: hypothetical protein AAB222_08155, partial [Candidatus Binatota bacterium]